MRISIIILLLAACGGGTDEPEERGIACNITSSGCACDGDSTMPNAFECSAASVDGFCCASNGYPTSSISDCTCKQFGCSGTGTGCMCSTSTQGSATCTPPANGHCCLTTGDFPTCRCGTLACGGSQIEVSSCTPSVISSNKCSAGDIKVSSCSIEM